MAKAIKVPTVAEMEEYKADSANRINDIDHWTMLKPMTLRIFKVVEADDMPDSAKVTAWNFCKQLTKFSHAPVSPAEYKKMEKYKGETELIDVLLKACDGYFPDPAFKYNFDTIGFSYSIALISISDHRRQDCLALLDRVTQYYVKTKDDWYTVLMRNMQKLVKDYPDLAPFKAALEAI